MSLLVEGVRPVEHADVAGLSPEAWAERLTRAAREPVQDGLLYPGFPDERTQTFSVGSAFDHAIEEARNFHVYVGEVRAAAKRPARGGRYLDFGCGWGRIGRFFLRDFERGEMVGVDVDPGMVAASRAAQAPGGSSSSLTVGRCRSPPLPSAW